MPPSGAATNPSWIKKFKCAFRGVKVGVRSESSFFVHFFAAAAVAAAALALQATLVEWCILILCVAVVLTAEMMNTALERLAKAVDQGPNPHLRDALDMGSAAVLLASIGAAVVGAIVFLNLLRETLAW
ncbi:MAG: diacylglycerol kinase [Planctomycetia bacterium]|nr:diacylglycerol kinase [Planctomycetia bacterium]